MAPYQVITSQNYPYLQKHSGVPGTEIAILKRAFFVEPMGVDGAVRFDAWFLRMRDDVRWTQPACLLDAADVSGTCSSLVEASRHPKFISNKSCN